MTKKQFISLDQALGYLQFLNTDKQAFTHKQFNVAETLNQPKSLQLKLKRVETGSRRNIDQNLAEQGDKKNRNKNRAIKRIIDTSKQLLQQNYKYEQPYQQNQKKSYITQFNIYLKQYNRLSQQILAQENELEEKKRLYIEHEQAKLEDVFSFTVDTDYRMMLDVAILKDKINKSNVEMVMETFKNSLVILKTNEIRIYERQTEDSPHRDVKLHQIQNVDYFSQPYIFTVMTIVKDKSSGSQYLCFKFDQIEKQHKWDRAVYCNFVSRRMKHKGKYFLLQFPQKQQEKQNNEGLEHIVKKRDDVKHYEIQRKKIIRNLQSQMNREREGTRMGTASMESQRDLPTIQRRGDKMERFNTDNQGNIASPHREHVSNILMSTKNSDQKDAMFKTNKKGADTNNQPQQDPNQRSISKPGSVTRPAPANGVTTNPASQSKQGTEMKSGDNDNMRQSQKSPANRLPRQTTPNVPFVIKQTMTESEELVEDGQKMKQKIINPFTKRKIELKEKHESGIRVMKIKFFSDKAKIIFLGAEDLQYWDFDAVTMHKSQKKIIHLSQLKSYKILRQKNSVNISFEVGSKVLIFSGRIQDLNDIIQWIQLPAKQRQFNQAQQSERIELFKKQPTIAVL